MDDDAGIHVDAENALFSLLQLGVINCKTKLCVLNTQIIQDKLSLDSAEYRPKGQGQSAAVCVLEA